MKDRVIFFLYLASLLVFTSIHDEILLLCALIVLFLFSGDSLVYLLKRTLKSIVAFTSVVSVSYLAAGFFQAVEYDFLILFNIRVFLLTYMTFFVFERINIFKALSFSKRLSWLVALSFSQINIYRRSFLEFWMGLMSRQPVLSYANWLKSVKSVTLFFMNKTLYSSRDISAGMKSRGFFDD